MLADFGTQPDHNRAPRGLGAWLMTTAANRGSTLP